MTSKLTREENVQAVFDLKAGYTLGLADVEILKRVARMALAALDSEPVAEVVSIYGDPEAFGEREIRPLVGIQQMPYGTKLYRHAQQPVASPELTREMYQEYFMRDDWRDNFRSGWEACRAAKSLHANSPVIPEGYVMVPKEPTAEMQSAGASAIRIETTALNKLWTGNAVFRAMLAAAPQEVNHG